MLTAGMVLAARYRVEDRIALGGMGEIWRAHDETLNRTVALKLLKPEYATDPSFVARFRAEARNAARLTHPGIATVYDYGEVAVPGAPGNTGFLVMELVPGQPLSAILRDRAPLSPDETMTIIGETAMALQAAHTAGVVHRDVKPANLVITPEGHVKVTDFGIARATDDVALTTTGSVLGTSYYLSPEQTKGHPATPASDIYSLGIVAYECLAGRRPFQDPNPVTVALAHQQQAPPPLPPGTPGAACSLVYDMLAKDPAQRPSSAGEVGRRALNADAAPQTRELTSAIDAVPAAPKRRLAAVAGLAGLSVAILATALVVSSPQSPHRDSVTGGPSAAPTSAHPSVTATPAPPTTAPSAATTGVTPRVATPVATRVVTPLPPTTPALAAPPKARPAGKAKKPHPHG